MPSEQESTAVSEPIGGSAPTVSSELTEDSEPKVFRWVLEVEDVFGLPDGAIEYLLIDHITHFTDQVQRTLRALSAGLGRC